MLPPTPQPPTLEEMLAGIGGGTTPPPPGAPPQQPTQTISQQGATLEQMLASLNGGTAPGATPPTLPVPAGYGLPQPVTTDQSQEWDYKTAQAGPQGEQLPPGAIGWRPDGSPDFGTGLDAWLKKTQWNLSNAWNTGWQEGERIAEEAGYQGDTMQRAVSSWNLFKAGVGSFLWEPLMGALSVPAQMVEQVGGSVGYALKDMVYENKSLDEIDWKGNWEASRLAYNEIMRPFLGKSGGLREQFNQRMLAGERPDIIAEDMLITGEASPWVELAFQLWFDPLNAFGKVGKLKQAAKYSKIAKTEMAVAETVEIADKLNDIAKADNLAQSIDKVSDLRKTILEAQDAAAASMDVLAKPGLIKKQNVVQRMRDLVKYTPDSRNQIVFNKASVMAETWMSSLGNNNAKMTELLKAIVDFRGADEGKSVSALINLLDSGVSPKMLFSPAGNDTMLIMEKMMSTHGDNLLSAFGKEAKIAKRVEITAKAAKRAKGAALAKAQSKVFDLEKAAKEIPGFEQNAKKMLEMMKATTDDMFPTAQKLLDAEKAVKAGGKVSDQTKALAELAGRMKPYERKVAELHNMLQGERGAVRIINRMYAKIYLGMSPGYAFRNMTQNRFQMWLDYGGKMLFGSGDEAIDIASKWHKSPLLAGEQFGNVDPRGALETPTVTDFWSGLKKWATGGGDWKKIGDTRILAANDEAWASRKIVGEMYQKTFKKALEPLINSVIKDKRFRKLPPEVMSSLKGELYNNFGDVDLAVTALKKKMASGFERPFTRFDKLPKAIQLYLSKAGYEGRFIQEVLNSPSSDDALAAAQKLFDDIAKEGLPAYADGIKPNLDDDIERAFNVALNDGDISFGAMRAKAARIHITDQTVDALSSMVQHASEQGNVLASVRDRFFDPIKGWTTRRDEVRTGVTAAVNIIKGRVDNVASSWDELRRILNIPEGIVPANKDEFIDMAWKAVDRYSSNLYGQDLLDKMDEVKEFLNVSKQTQYLDELDALRKNFEAYQNIAIADGGVLVSENPLVGTRPNIIRQIAGKYKIASVTETGAPLDKLLVNIINKYSEIDEPFKTLDDPISLDMVNRAFAKYGKVEPIVLGKTFPAGEETILRLAESFGVKDQDILKLVNESISKISFAPEAENFHNYQDGITDLIARGYQLSPKDFADTFRGKAGRDKLGVRPGLIAKSGKGVGLDYIATALKEGGYITADEADDLNFVRDFLRGEIPVTPKQFSETFEYTKLGDIPELVAKRAFEEAGLKAKTTEKVRKVGGVEIPSNVLKVPTKEPSYSALINMNNERAMKDVLDYIGAGFDEISEITNVADDNLLAELAKTLNQRMGEIRVVSARVAHAHRDFTLLNYGEQTYSGVMASYLFPYYKWYAGTYSNYAQRLMSNPAILGHYGMIKDRMAQEHADLLDWWKYNLSADDFPEPIQKAVAGVEKFFGMEEQPLFLNIESLLWPLQGLTGIDFNDKEKVVDWWTFALDQLGKGGPTVWTPITLATGLKLLADGEQEAGERWVGRLSSQTSTIKSITGQEIDPLVNLFMGGVDPYERKRVRRALADMALNNQNPEFQAQAVDAAYNQEGALWEEAVRKAGKDRMLGNIMSTMFGVGLKARTESDLQVDMFYSEYMRTMSMRTMMSPEDFRQQMIILGEKYPFMDIVLIGNKTEEKRDAAFAYHVLSRVPPGDMSTLLEFVGVRQDTIDYFYENKGDLSGMTKDDRMRFNAAMLSLSAIMQIPDTATKQEWNVVKFQYSEVQQRAGFQDENGEDTKLAFKLQTYYDLLERDRRLGGEYLDSNPDLRRAMELKNAYIANNPTLGAYYGGIETIEKYYQSLVRAEMIKKYGEEIYQKFDYYNNLLDPAEKKSYLFANPDLKSFKDEYGDWKDYVNRETAKLVKGMPEGKAPTFRVAETETQKALQEMVLQGQRPVSAQELLSQMSPELTQMVQLYGQGQELSYQAKQQLDYLGDYYGISGDEVLQILLSQ